MTSNKKSQWAYNPEEENFINNVEYAYLYCGKSLNEFEEYKVIQRKLDYHKKAIKSAKIILTENINLYDLFPKDLIIELAKVKQQITENVFNEYKKPANYEILKNLLVLITDLNNRQYNSGSISVIYQMFKEPSGRLTTNSRGFPLLTANSDKRKSIKPNNDIFLSIDLVSAEWQSFFYLINKPFIEDIYNYHKDILKTKTRAEAKKQSLIWLYSDSKNKLNEYYDKESLIEKYWKNGSITTDFERTIFCEKDKAFLFLNRGTLNDIFYSQVQKVYEFLKTKESNIAFLLHDEMIIDFSLKDRKYVNDIVNLFSNNSWTINPLKVQVRLGKNLAEFKKVSLECQQH